MKASFIKPALFVLLGIFIGMYFLRCGNDAGIGSDFDATKYYTKDEVDTMVANNKTTILRGYSPNLTSGASRYFLFSQTPPSGSFLVPVNGTLTNLCVKADFPPTEDADIQVVVNGSGSALIVQYFSSDGTSLKVNSSTLTVNQGDIIDLYIANTGINDTATGYYASFIFTASE